MEQRRTMFWGVLCSVLASCAVVGAPEGCCPGAEAAPPRGVLNFTCLSLYWTSLTCTWRSPGNCFETQYSLTYHLSSYHGRLRTKYTCMNITLDAETGEYSCYWDSYTSPRYTPSSRIYYFNLTSSSKFNSISQDFNFFHFAFVKSPPPENLTVVNKTAHSVLLSWDTPHPMYRASGLLYRVEYHDPFVMPTRLFTANTWALPRKPSTQIYNLLYLPYAYHQYCVRVSCLSEEAIGEELWSDYALCCFHTSGEPPKRPPDIDEGSFEVKANLSHRAVRVYWRQLQIFELNGENFHYKVEVYTEGLKLESTPSKSKKGYIYYRGLPLKSLQFLIAACNDEGNSSTKSSLVVPTQSQILPKMSFFINVDLGNGIYKLRWNHPDVDMSTVESYTIFWCDNFNDRRYRCEGRLEWQRVPGNQTSGIYTLKEDKIYQFSISANGNGSSSGMVWT